MQSLILKTRREICTWKGGLDGWSIPSNMKELCCHGTEAFAFLLNSELLACSVLQSYSEYCVP